ncbi:GNAT family N-acetyltransferase [Actinorugispora endophytica]|uniref:Acetyltransferase (GNAT) family protein n=1 Tax=Actinorugispora endophytica TaxID=1605990 RepID=A0A4R6V3V8_9ACTN|nr:GNAT family N-acetyltransferase [Actinorugispora endophytica]TDQ53451.1 acetyltransferase (GNAT) family protein [Actinorugispora endophytica]
MRASTTDWAIAPVPPDHPDAAAVLRRYTADVAGRYYGRPATEEEVDAAIAGDPSDDLAPPDGLFLLARGRDGVAGCVGVRRVDAGTAELRRLFVSAEARGSGCGSALVAAAEQAARGLGAATIRLDTRRDLVEARSLYARRGYTEVPPFNDGPYADHWYAKRL